MAQAKKSGVYYGWVIVGVLALSMFLAYVIRSSFSVFYVAILDEFGWTRAETAGIFSLCLIVYGFGGIISGFLLDKLGPRKLFPMAAAIITLGALWCSRATAIWQFYLAFGVLVGFGQCSLGYVPTMTMVNHWFARKRGIALGIAMFGLSLSFLLSPLTQYLRGTIGWRNAMAIYALATFAIVAPLTALLLRHRPQDLGLLPDGEAGTGAASTSRSRDAGIVNREWCAQEWTLPRALKTRRLWMLVVLALMMGIMTNFPQVHEVAYITDIGYSAMFAATAFTIFGLLNGMGPVGGFLSDRVGREVCATIGALFIAAGMMLALTIRTTGLEWAWYLSSASYGLGVGLLSPTLPATYGDLFWGKNLGSIIGFINMGFGMGGAIGPWVAGKIYDVTQSYQVAFMLVAAASGLAIVMMWLVSPRKIRLVAGKVPKAPAGFPG